MYASPRNKPGHAEKTELAETQNSHVSICLVTLTSIRLPTAHFYHRARVLQAETTTEGRRWPGSEKEPESEQRPALHSSRASAVSLESEVSELDRQWPAPQTAVEWGPITQFPLIQSDPPCHAQSPDTQWKCFHRHIPVRGMTLWRVSVLKTFISARFPLSNRPHCLPWGGAQKGHKN